MLQFIETKKIIFKFIRFLFLAVGGFVFLLPLISQIGMNNFYEKDFEAV